MNVRINVSDLRKKWQISASHHFEILTRYGTAKKYIQILLTDSYLLRRVVKIDK